MSIRVVCPNGHALKIKEEFAGKLGLCPVCKAQVHVPALQTPDLSEDAILDIMGKGGPAPRSAADTKRSPVPVLAGQGKKDRQAPPKKSCSKCNREIVAGIHICPYCHTYIASLGDF
jgi:hypothetical protein